MTRLQIHLNQPTVSLWRRVLTDIKYQLWSRHVLGGAAVFLGMALVSVIGLGSKVGGKLDLFQRTLAESRGQGITLQQALAQPVKVTRDAQGESIDNILRFDYETARTALGSLDPLGFAVNSLQLVTFVVVPAVCVVLSVVMATHDYRYGTIKIRAVRQSLLNLQISQLVSCSVLMVVLLLGSVLVTIPASMLYRWWYLRDRDVSIFGTISSPTSLSELAQTLTLSIAVALFFSCVGLSLGLVFRRALAPVLAFIVWNTMVPILGTWDPRNLWSLIGHRVFHLEGVFVLSPASGASVPFAAAVLAVSVPLVLVLGHVVSRRASRFAV